MMVPEEEGRNRKGNSPISSPDKSVVHILIMKDALFQSGTLYLRRIIMFFISAQTFSKNLISIGFHHERNFTRLLEMEKQLI